MILITVYYLSVFLIYWSSRNRNLSKNALTMQCFWAFVLLFVFFGFRDITVLNDTPHYYAPVREKMSQASHLGWFDFELLSRIEPGYQIFENFVAKIFSNPYAIVLVSSLFITVGNIKFFKVTKEGLFLCLFLMLNFQIGNQYSAIRQAFATLIFYYGFTKYLKGNWILFILSVLFASAFHITAIMLLLLIPLCKIKFEKKTIALFIIAFIVTTQYLLQPLVALFSTDTLYMDTNAERESFPIASLILGLLNLWLIYLSKRISDKYNIVVENKLWMVSAACIMVSFMDVVFPIIGRMAMYLFPILVLTFVSCVTKIPNRRYRDKTILLVCMVYFAWFVTYNIMKPEWYHLYPYSFMDIDKVYMYDEVR